MQRCPLWAHGGDDNRCFGGRRRLPSIRRSLPTMTLSRQSSVNWCCGYPYRYRHLLACSRRNICVGRTNCRCMQLNARIAGAAGQTAFYRKGSALTPNWFATGRQPYTAPGKTMLAPVPIAIELESPPSRSIPSLAPRSARVRNIKVGEI